MSSAALASGTEARILHEDDDIVVIHRPGASAFTLVTFAGMGERPQGLRFWARDPVEKLDLHAIGFVGKRANWYPAQAVARAAPHIRALLRGPAIGYGFSMGGYGALKHGRLLGLDAALAVSPQVSIDPADVPQDRRYHHNFDPRLNAGMAVAPDDLPGFAVTLADPHHPLDRLHAEAAGPPGRVRRIWLPFMRHGTIARLTGSRLISEVLALVLAQDPDGLCHLMRSRRRDSRHWHHQLAHAALLRGHDAMAERLWADAAALGTPAGVVAQMRLNAERERAGVPAPAWRRAAHARANKSLLHAAEAGEPALVRRLATRLPAARMLPRGVIAAVNAALALDNSSAIEDAAALAVSAELPVQIRNLAAQRLASGSQGIPALAVLLATPENFEQQEVRERGATIALTAQRDTAMPALWQQVARALHRRLAGAAEPAAPMAVASPFSPDVTAALPRPLSAFPWIGESPGAPHAATREFRSAVEAQGRHEATPPAAAVRLLRDVFVNARGQIWAREGAVHRGLGRPVAEASLAAMADAPEVVEAAFAVEPFNNIYHWTVDILPGTAWRLDGAGEGMPVLVREDPAPYVQDWLDTASGTAVPTIGVGAATFVRRLHLGRAGLRHLAPFGAHASLLARVGGRVDALGTPGPRRVYVSRRDGRNRPLRNEDALEEALRARGFESITFRGLPLVSQAALLRDAEAIVATHGAGLANLLLARPGRRVFEIIPGTTGLMSLRACFAQLSRLCGHHHAVWIEAFNDTFGAWSIDLDPALAQIDRFLAGEVPANPP